MSLFGPEGLYRRISKADFEQLRQMPEYQDTMDRLSRNLEPEILRIFETAEAQEVQYDQIRWMMFLDWVDVVLPKILMYDPRLPANKRGENHPMYKHFEIFSRGKTELAGEAIGNVAFALMGAYREFEKRAKAFFKVRGVDEKELDGA